MRETAGKNPLPLLQSPMGVRCSARSTRSCLAARCGFSDARCRTPSPIRYSEYLPGSGVPVLQKRAERLKGWSLRELRTQQELPPVPTTLGSERLLRGGTVPCSLAAATPWRSSPCKAAPPCFLPGRVESVFSQNTDVGGYGVPYASSVRTRSLAAAIPPDRASVRPPVCKDSCIFSSIF